MDEVAEILETTDVAEVEAPEVETTEIETDAPVETVATKPEGEETDKVAEDGRTLPKEVQKALKALRENPETSKVARALNDSYFREQAYAKHGTVAQIAAANATLSRVGGEEGITHLEQASEEMRRVDEQIAEGRADYLDSIAKNHPEGFKKLIPAALDKLWNLDKAAYARTIAPIISNTLKNYLSRSSDPTEVLKQMQSDIEEEIRNAPRVQDNTESDKTKAEWDKIYAEKHKSELGAVGSQTTSYQQQLVNKNLAPLLKSRPLSTGAKSDLNDGISQEIQKILIGDAGYQSQVRAAVEKIKQDVRTGKDVSGQRKSLANYINAKMDEIAPKAVKGVWNRRYGSVPATKKAPVAGAPSFTPGQKPAMNQVDKVPGWDTLYISGRAYVKGKLVTWK